MRGDRKKIARCPPRQPGGNGPAAGEAQGRDSRARRGWEPGGGDRAAELCVCSETASGLCRWDPFGEVGVGLQGARGRGRPEGRVTSRSLLEAGGPRRPPPVSGSVPREAPGSKDHSGLGTQSSSRPALGRGWMPPFAEKTFPSGPRTTRAARIPPLRLVPTFEQRGLSGGDVAGTEAQSRMLASALKRLGDSPQRTAQCLPFQSLGAPVPIWSQPRVSAHLLARPSWAPDHLAWGSSRRAAMEWPAAQWKLLLGGGPEASPLPGRRATVCRRFTAALEEKIRRPL